MALGEIPTELVTPAQVGLWVFILVVVAKGINEVRNMVAGFGPTKPTHISPSPLTVKAHEEFVNKAEFESAMKRVEGDINSLRTSIDSNREASEESRARLYARVDTVAREFQAAIEKTNNRIDTIPDRVIAQLSNLHLLKTPTP